VLALTIGPLTALAYFGLAGALLAGIGRLLGGSADSSDTRVALACSVVPDVVALPLWALAIGYYGAGLFTQEQAVMPLGVAVLLALSVALTVWGWILRVVMIAEVHDFTRWRSFATIVLSWLATIAVVVAIVAALAALLPTNSAKG
jgi:Kef-type K+ transport system membrane component KefB